MRQALLGLILLGCGGSPPPVAIEPDGTEFCAEACARLNDLGCAEGQPLSDGTSCEVFCIQTQEKGHPLNPSCVAEISSCDEISLCTSVL
jgi:hypothetical protein